MSKEIDVIEEGQMEVKLEGKTTIDLGEGKSVEIGFGLWDDKPVQDVTLLEHGTPIGQVVAGLDPVAALKYYNSESESAKDLVANDTLFVVKQYFYDGKVIPDYAAEQFYSLIEKNKEKITEDTDYFVRILKAFLQKQIKPEEPPKPKTFVTKF